MIMKILFNLILTTVTITIINFSNSSATEIFERGKEAMHSQISRSQFDPRLSREYIEQEKKESRKKGFEEGTEMGRIEEAKIVALRMLSKDIDEKVISEGTELSLQQIQELKSTLNSLNAF